MAQQNRPDLNPDQIEDHLGGIDYPIQKQDLKEQALNKNAPYYIIEVIDQLPNQRYKNSSELDKGIHSTQ